MAVSRAALVAIRTDSCHLAASFYPEAPNDLAELWKLTRFFEQVLLGGTDAALAEFGPKPKLRLVQGQSNG